MKCDKYNNGKLASGQWVTLLLHSKCREYLAISYYNVLIFEFKFDDKSTIINSYTYKKRFTQSPAVSQCYYRKYILLYIYELHERNLYCYHGHLLLYN